MGDALEPFLIPFSPPLSSEALDLSPAPLEDCLWEKKKKGFINEFNFVVGKGAHLCLPDSNVRSRGPFPPSLSGASQYCFPSSIDAFQLHLSWKSKKLNIICLCSVPQKSPFPIPLND